MGDFAAGAGRIKGRAGEQENAEGQVTRHHVSRDRQERRAAQSANSVEKRDRSVVTRTTLFAT